MYKMGSYFLMGYWTTQGTDKKEKREREKEGKWGAA